MPSLSRATSGLLRSFARPDVTTFAPWIHHRKTSSISPNQSVEMTRSASSGQSAQVQSSVSPQQFTRALTQRRAKKSPGKGDGSKASAQRGQRLKNTELYRAMVVRHGLPITVQIPAAEKLAGHNRILVKDLSSGHLSQLAPSSRLSMVEVVRADKELSRIQRRTEHAGDYLSGPPTVVTFASLPAATTIEDVLASLRRAAQSGKVRPSDARLVDARIRQARDKGKGHPATMVARVEFANPYGAAQIHDLAKARSLRIRGAVPLTMLARSRSVPKQPFVPTVEGEAMAGGTLGPFSHGPRTVLDQMKRGDKPVRRTHLNYNREESDAADDDAHLRLGVKFRSTRLFDGHDDASSGSSGVDNSQRAGETSTGGSELKEPERADQLLPDDSVSDSAELEQVEAHSKRQIAQMAAHHKRHVENLTAHLENTEEAQARLKLSEARLALVEQEARTKGWLGGLDQTPSGASELMEADRVK